MSARVTIVNFLKKLEGTSVVVSGALPWCSIGEDSWAYKA